MVRSADEIRFGGLDMTNRVVAVVGAMLLALAALGLFLAAVETSSAAQPATWRRLSAATSPSGRTGASMAYDAATHQLVLFGGYGRTPRKPGSTAPAVSTYGDLSTTWTWNGRTWTKRSPAESPPARQDASMAYDTATHQLVLFGGAGVTNFLPTTWVWNGTTWKLVPTTVITSPPASGYAAMAYDAASGQLVLFGGGGDAGAEFSTTWIWEGTAWKKLSPAESPPARDGAPMAYDSRMRQLVLFGGTGDSGRLSTTWTWNGTTWTKLNPANRPSARGWASMAYTPDGRLVLFGGAGPPGARGLPGLLSTSWAWNGATWTVLAQSPSPPARDEASMAYDTATDQLVLFGGDGSSSSVTSGLLSTTWVRGLSRA